MKTIRDFDLKNKRVIVRCDFNVPIKDGKILDDSKIKASLRTIKYIVKKGGKAILLSHLGRITNEDDKKLYSLKPVSLKLSEYLKKEVVFIPVTCGGDAEKIIKKMKPKDIVLLENTRFEDLNKERESKNSKVFAKKLASLGDIFIDDAFGCVHRSHASNVGIAKLLPSGIGFLMESELKALSKVTDNVKRPYVVILGGAKTGDKIGIINSLAKKADFLLIGGKMSFTFLKAAGFNVGLSSVENDSLDYCVEMLDKYSDKIILPIDVVTAVSPDDEPKVRFINEIGSDEVIYDIGPQTLKVFKQYLSDCKTVFWNGPVGYYEIPKFDNGTKELLSVISKTKAISVVGGGDMASATVNLGYGNKVTHISTGGGASLKLIEGKVLPALKVLDEK